MNTPNLEKVLKKHFQHCKMHEYSLMQDRHCTCGVEGARAELDAVKEKAKELKEAVSRYDDGNPDYPWAVIRFILAEFYDLL